MTEAILRARVERLERSVVDLQQELRRSRVEAAPVRRWLTSALALGLMLTAAGV